MQTLEHEDDEPLAELQNVIESTDQNLLPPIDRQALTAIKEILMMAEIHRPLESADHLKTQVSFTLQKSPSLDELLQAFPPPKLTDLTD